MTQQITDAQIIAAPRYYSELIATQSAEIARLKRGDFMPAELQDLCHNKAVEAGFCAFVTGCDEYQRTLFGKAGIDDIRTELSDLFALLEKDTRGRWCFQSLSQDGAKFDAVIERLSERLK